METSNAVEEPDKVEHNNIGNSRMTQETKRLLPVKHSAFVLPATVRNIKTSKGAETIVYLDQGADETWISKDLYKTLQLKPLAMSNVIVSTVVGDETYEDTPIVMFEVESLDKSEKDIVICRVMDTMPQCTLQDLTKVKNKYAFLKDVPVATTTADQVGLCIGRDNLHLLTHLEVRQGKKTQPIAYRTKLGWTICVPQQQEDDGVSSNFVTNSTWTRQDLEEAFSSVRQYAIKAGARNEIRCTDGILEELQQYQEDLLIEPSLMVQGGGKMV